MVTKAAGPPAGRAGRQQRSGRTGCAPPLPVTPRVSARVTYRLSLLLQPNAGYRRLAEWLTGRPRLRAAFTAVERGVKHEAFGCRMCGQCALPQTGYACPMTCPKQLRNGPCGGVGADGSCEVYPGTRCVWLVAFERADGEGRVADLTLLHRPVDHRRWGESAWLSYWQGRDDALCTNDDGLAEPASLIVGGPA